MLFYVPSNKFLISCGKTQGIQIWSTSMVKQRSSFQKLHAVVPCSSTLPLPNLLQPKDAKLYHLWYAAQSPMLYSLGIASSNKVETLSPSLINIKFIHSYWILIDSQAYFDLSSLLWLSPRSDLDALWPIYGPMAPLLPLTWCRSVVVRVTIFGRAYYLAGMATHGNPWQPRTSTWLKTWLVKGWRSSKRWPAPNVLEEGGPWRTNLVIFRDRAMIQHPELGPSMCLQAAGPTSTTRQDRATNEVGQKDIPWWWWIHGGLFCTLWGILGRSGKWFSPATSHIWIWTAITSLHKDCIRRFFCMCCDIHFGLCLHWCTWTSIYIYI